MSQTSYNRYFSGPFAGQILDTGDHYKRSRLNLASGSADIRAGVGVVAKSANETACDLPSAATQALVGLVINDFARDPDSLTGSAAVKYQTQAPLMVEGPLWVFVEQDVTEADQVFVRYSANGGSTTLGAFRKDLDGVADVWTLTPTASQDSTVFVVRVEVAGRSWVFEYTSDGTMTATEVCDGLRTKMAADTAFTALVVASGTSTLILTGQTAGQALLVTAPGNGAFTSITNTTPAAPHARRVKGARFLGSSATTASGEKVAPVYFSASVDAANV